MKALYIELSTTPEFKSAKYHEPIKGHPLIYVPEKKILLSWQETISHFWSRWDRYRYLLIGKDEQLAFDIFDGLLSKEKPESVKGVKFSSIEKQIKIEVDEFDIDPGIANQLEKLLDEPIESESKRIIEFNIKKADITK